MECGASEVSGLPHRDTSSIMSLFLFHFLACIFFSPLLRPLLLSFFFLALHFCLLCLSLYRCPFLPWCWDVFQPVCMTEENEEKKLRGSVSGLDPNIHLLFSPFCLSLFILRIHLPKWQELPVTGLAQSMQYIYSKCFNPYAQKLFICINNRGIVHQKLLSFSCLSPWNFNLISTCNFFHRVALRSIINMQVAIFLTLGQE